MSEHGSTESNFIRAYERWLYYLDSGRVGMARINLVSARRNWARMSSEQRKRHNDKAGSLKAGVAKA